MDSYRPHSHAGHRFHTFHMFVDEFRLQLVSVYRTAVYLCEDLAQQSDVLGLEGVGQHHPKCSLAATSNNLCLVCCSKYNKATAYGNMPHNWRKTTFWCSTCQKYLCLRVGSTASQVTCVTRLACLAASDGPRTTLNFILMWIGGMHRARTPIAGELYHTQS